MAAFESHKFEMAFANARLSRAIAPGEFQCILTGANRESDVARLEALLTLTRE